MSKSYGNDLWVFESGKKLRTAVNRIVTDSQPPEVQKDPDAILLFRFLELFLDEAELATWKERVRRGGPDAPGYGHLKVRITEAIEAHFAPARRRREELVRTRRRWTASWPTGPAAPASAPSSCSTARAGPADCASTGGGGVAQRPRSGSQSRPFAAVPRRRG
jgi:hypothetical protein